MKRALPFVDRADAGRQLAARLSEYAGRKDVLFYALPRGGVVVAAEVAKALHLPFDVIVTRKIGAPSHEEYAIGALAETGEYVWNDDERDAADKDALARIMVEEEEETVRRVQTYRGGRPLPTFEGMTIVIVDDGIATGLTMRAAIAVARHQKALKVVVAVPHGARDTLETMRGDVDRVIALEEPEFYGAVGSFYEDFPQTSDEEVLTLLKRYGSH